MGGGLKVLCSTCGDAVTAGIECPTCGEPEPASEHPDREARVDETLLARVDLALEAQAKLAQTNAVRRTSHAVDLNAEAVELRRRLRTQRALLRGLIARRRDLVDARAALSALELALDPERPGPDLGWRWQLQVDLPRDPTCASVARRLLREYISEALDPTPAADALLVATELVTNALRHGAGTITFGAERLEDALRIDVADEGGPARIVIDPSRGGLGLRLVDRIAIAWGVEESRPLVWAELPLRDSDLRP